MRKQVCVLGHENPLLPNYICTCTCIYDIDIVIKDTWNNTTLSLTFLADLRQGFDINREPVLENMESTMGFLNALRIASRVRQRGLAMLGLPCNSHSFMSSSIHMRSTSMPFGNEERSLVVYGNLLAYRTTLVILLCIVKGVAWFLENPGGSKCLLLPAFAKLLELRGLLGSTTWNWWGLQFSQESKKCILSPLYHQRPINFLGHILPWESGSGYI